MSDSPSHSTEPPELCESSLLSVDLSAVRRNWRLLADLSDGAECSGMLKANAYGLGLEPVMRALLAEGCRTFFVATAAEGVRARAVSSEAAIYILEGLAPGCGDPLAEAGLIPVLGSIEEIAEWAPSGLDAAVQIDSGMNRMGLPLGEVPAAAAAIRPRLIMSHFVASQMPDDPLNESQIAALSAARAAFPGIAASLCNSSGIFLPHKPLFDLTRPGYALFGGNPTPRAPNPMQPVARLRARIMATRDIAPGQSVGYDATWIATRPTRLATVGVGYADGVPVGASSATGKLPAEALVGGRRCPLVGRVSMDFIVLDVTETPPGAARRGEWVELLGDEIGIDELAARSQTIGYEILTRLGPRHARRFIGA
jgi:alanine racemase